MGTSGIYGFKNIANGKWWIGQSVDMIVRKNKHLSTLRRNKSAHMHFQNAFNKYGEDSFEWHVIEECAEEMLDNRETAWIAYYNSANREYGYNIERGGVRNGKHHPSEETLVKMRLAHLGKSNCLGRKASEETRKKQRQAKLGKPGKGSNAFGHVVTEETRKKISQANKGKQTRLGHKATPETIERLRLSHLGKKHSKEQCEKMRQSMLGKKCTEEHKKKISQTRIRLGIKQSAESRRKIGLFFKGKPWSEARRNACKKREIINAPIT